MTEDKGNKEQYMQGLGVTSDDVAKVTAEAMLENLTNDVKSYEKALDTAKQDLENYNEQAEVDLAVYAILEKEGALEMIRPEYNYQTFPEYKELARKKQLFKHRMDRATIEGHRKRLQAIVAADEEALKNAKEKLAKFGGQ